MSDIFENKILCNDCEKVMKPQLVSKNGFNLRALKCPECGKLIFHPNDKAEYENFMRLKNKEFEVKMRMVGNSYAVSIPREIVNFMKEQEKIMNNMVRLCFEDSGKVSLNFNPVENENVKQRIVSSKEVRIIKDGKPVLHARRIIDSAHPERNQTKIYKADKSNSTEEMEEDQ